MQLRLLGQILLGQIPVRADSCFVTQTVRADSIRADSVRADSCFVTQTVRADSVRADSVRADSCSPTQIVRADSVRADSVRAESVRAGSVRAEYVRADSVRAGYITPSRSPNPVDIGTTPPVTFIPIPEGYTMSCFQLESRAGFWLWG